MDEDFEVEVSDLRTGQVLKTARNMPAQPMAAPLVAAPLTIPLAAQANELDFEVEISGVAPSAAAPIAPYAPGMGTLPPSRPPLRRRQVYGAVATGALIVVVLVAILGGVVSRNGLTFGLFPTPAPTATLAPGVDTFYVVDGVPWGTLRADGNVVNVAYSQQGPAFFHLPIGRHTIEYDAAPFARVSCTVSVPAASSDSCPLFTSQDTNFKSNYGILDNDRGIDLKDTLSALPLEQLQALTNVAEQSLDTPLATTTVPVGGRYQGANGQMLTAAHPLKAQVFYTLNTNPNSGFGQNCVSLCDLSFGNGGPGTGTGWDVLASVLPTWRYTDPSTGSTVELPGTPQVPGTPSDQPASPYSATVLSVNWTGAWQVTPFIEDGGYGVQPGCFRLDNVLSQSPNLQSAFPNANGYQPNDVAAPNPADGCLMAYTVVDQQGNPVSKPLWFLYRFGLFFAANPLAQKIVPTLPVATGSEAELVKQLAPLLQSPGNG